MLEWSKKIECLGLWERLNNADSNSVEFDGIGIVYASEAHLLNVALIGQTLGEPATESD